MKKPFNPFVNPFIKVAFSSDPRVIEWARTRFEIKPDDKKTLIAKVETLYEMAEKGVKPQADWLKDAQDLAERLGKGWDFNRDEKPEDVLKEAIKHADKRIPQVPPAATDYVVQEGSRFVMRSASRVREIVLGVPLTMIRAGDTVVIVTQGYVPFRLRRIVIADEICQHFLINDVKIGKNCQIGNVEPIPASVFSSRAFPLPLSCDTAQVSQRIAMTVTNQSGAHFTFTAALHGVGIE